VGGPRAQITGRHICHSYDVKEKKNTSLNVARVKLTANCERNDTTSSAYVCYVANIVAVKAIVTILFLDSGNFRNVWGCTSFKLIRDVPVVTPQVLVVYSDV
jgi:hypothetical protein